MNGLLRGPLLVEGHGSWAPLNPALDNILTSVSLHTNFQFQQPDRGIYSSRVPGPILRNFSGCTISKVHV